jgi:hypothetical protein
MSCTTNIKSQKTGYSSRKVSKKSKLAIGAVTALALLSAPAAAATAAPQRTDVDNLPLFASGIPCFPNNPSRTFTVDAFQVANKEKVTTTTLANGDVVIRTTGKLVLLFQNHTTGKSIVKDVSGSTTETDYPTTPAIIRFVGTGNNWFGFGPGGQANTGEPGLVFTSGKVVVKIVGNTAQSLSLDGHQENGCALLSPRR